MARCANRRAAIQMTRDGIRTAYRRGPVVKCGADLDNRDFARAAYQLADAMLVARQEPSK